MSFFSVSSAPSESPIQAAPYRASERWTLWPRLRLYVDRLELTEWRGWRRVWCRLPLEALEQVHVPASGRLMLRTGERQSDCTPLTLKLDEAEQWARAIRAFRACLDTSV
jgi:hypothetical protein